MEIFNGTGLLWLDWIIAILTGMAGIAQAWTLAEYRGRYNTVYTFGRMVAGLGWTIWSIRFFSELILGGDPKVSVVGAAAVLLVTTGTIFASFLGKIR